MANDLPLTWVVEHQLKVDLYYEGYVDDIDLVKQQHQAYTVSTFGIRRSWVINASTHTTLVDEVATSTDTQGKENKVLYKGYIKLYTQIIYFQVESIAP